MKLRIGTRGSPLALEQTNLFINQLNQIGITDVEIIPIKTSGDIINDRPLYDMGGKSLFSKEIEAALFDNRIDCAVHSLKDLETISPPGLIIGCVLKRGDPRDCLISINNLKLQDLPEGSKIGTCAPRREAQLKMLRPDLRIFPIRGNVQTRLDRIKDGHFDATLLAFVGLERLGLELESCEIFKPHEILPAAGQGTIAVQIREKDKKLQELLTPLDHKETSLCIQAEREVLRQIHGDCRTPIAAYAIINEPGKIYLRARLWREGLYTEAEGSGEDPLLLAQEVANTLILNEEPRLD